VDFGCVVRDAAAEEAPVAAHHDVSVDAPDGLSVQGSPDDLHRLVLNLIENAVAHTPAGTAVRVAARRENGLVRLEVADEGPGVAPDVRERLFERFVRGGGYGARGSGLGLSIVDAVARTHGGTVQLADGDGERGARFVVELPAADAPDRGSSPIVERVTPSA
jgi:signal transduction histidine kinase